MPLAALDSGTEPPGLRTTVGPDIESPVNSDHAADGRPTGLFLESATTLVNPVRQPYSLAELTASLATASAICEFKWADGVSAPGDIAASVVIEADAAPRLTR